MGNAVVEGHWLGHAKSVSHEFWLGFAKILMFLPIGGYTPEILSLSERSVRHTHALTSLARYLLLMGDLTPPPSIELKSVSPGTSLGALISISKGGFRQNP
jgi:hypothetical protein